MAQYDAVEISKIVDRVGLFQAITAEVKSEEVKNWQLRELWEDVNEKIQRINSFLNNAWDEHLFNSLYSDGEPTTDVICNDEEEDLDDDEEDIFLGSEEFDDKDL